MPNDLHKDVEQSRHHGAQLTEQLNSYLSGQGKTLSDYEKKRNTELGGNVGAGLTGLEYLTGSKQPEVETFYDKHPVQAVGRNVADSATGIGAGVAAFGAGRNLFNDMMHSHKYNKIEDHMLNGKEDKEGKPGKPGSGGGFGSPDPYVVGEDHKQSDKGRAALGLGEEEHSHGFKNPAEREGYHKFNAIFQKIPGRNMMTDWTDEEYARFIEHNLPKALGGSTHVPNVDVMHRMLEKHLGGNTDRAQKIVDIMQNRLGNNSVKGVMGRSLGGKGMFNDAAKGVAGMLPKSIQDAKISPGLLRGVSRVKGPAMLGGAIAAGGMGLSAILHAIHKHTYGDKQIKDWTNNMRMVKGKFDEVEK